MIQTANTQSCRMFYTNGEKFKTNAYLAFYRIPLQREEATKLAVLTEIYRSGIQTGFAKDDAEVLVAVQKEAENLYGALWDIQIVKKGAEAWLSFSLEVAKHVTEQEALDFLSALMRPVTQEMCTQVLERRKAILRRRLEAQADDKMTYATLRCQELTGGQTGFGVCADGYLEDLEQITAEGLMAFDTKIRRHAPLYLFFCGDAEGRKNLKQWKKHLEVSTETIWIFPKVYLEPREVQMVRDRQKVSQTRLAMGFVSNISPKSRKMMALRVLCECLGSSGSGLLFQQLREQQGLCYDISLRCDRMSGLVYAQTGVAQKDLKQSASQIVKIIKNVARQGIAEADFQNAKRQIAQQIQDIADHPWQILDFVAEQEVLQTNADTQTYLHLLENMEQEEIKKAAADLELATIYILTSEEEKKCQTCDMPQESALCGI